jgi:hypothetical protein
VARDPVDRLAAGKEPDVDPVEAREQVDERARGARPAAVCPGVAAGPRDGQPDADAADRVDGDVVDPVPLERDRRLNRKRRARMARAAQAAEALLADREDDDERLVERRREPVDDVGADRDGDGVVADPRAGQPSVVLPDQVRNVGRKDGVDVREQRQAEGRLAEAPDEVADGVPLSLARCGREPLLEPRDPCLLGSIRGGDLGQRDRVALDICTNVREDRASLLV